MFRFGQSPRFRRGHTPHRRHRRRSHSSIQNFLTLADVAPGVQVRVIGFLPGMPTERGIHLLAYGLTPGTLVRVQQHSPVTVLQIEHLELALEAILTRQILVSLV